ncbi:A/G-specific adenine glycosylase [Candidatus Hydrogenisulfobacillus filiaventi]|uniref:Adenine DNA glycosylase n=1 Tax=Candidatus Hydrogenisulfobacillus filiaventi TaxID=2707344 RepID=A0A6F8ZGZ7_9FIRM|nr:A/G-specific adenine glycosylase [Bacillota bacterium]CAB1128947.1 A/G-specific adenine glycosylase [Candidatus Hydrogenisulfobacillus filiaventi]
MKRLFKYRAVVAPGPLTLFRRELAAWYRRHGRDLPWRRTRDPYAILVSEVLLHQTQVRTVIPVYEAFLARFPTLDALAGAPLAEVKAITDPLGYKVRGRWLWEIARAVTARHGGRIPDSWEELLALPGVGRYTAGAVRSFAFGLRSPILDTNVERVLGRYFEVPALGPGGRGAERRHHLWALAEAVLPEEGADQFNQALMDLGALICTARKPACLLCPVAGGCARLGGGLRAAEPPALYRVEPAGDESGRLSGA